MGSGKAEPGKGMVKFYKGPFVCRMAVLTICFRIVLLVNVSFMDILVTVAAIFTYVSEFPFNFLFMKFEAWSCQMSSGQFETSFVMLFNCK